MPKQIVEQLLWAYLLYSSWLTYLKLHIALADAAVLYYTWTMQ
jgi:hypothetical protein